MSARDPQPLGMVERQVVELIARQAQPGLVVDLVIGSAAPGPSDPTAFASALREAGCSYLGVGDREDTVDVLGRQGLAAVRVDLDDLSRLVDVLDDAGDDPGPIRAICLRGRLGALPDPGDLLRVLAEYVAAHCGPDGGPLLIVTVPNIGHRDVALKLLAGRWLHEPIDDPSAMTPLRFFTRESLVALVERSGWRCVAVHDLERERSDQYDVELLLHAPTLAGDFLREVGRVFNTDAQVSDFIWALRPVSVVPYSSPDADPVAAERDASQPAVSILMRTQGRRNELLTEALYSIYAQTSDAYEVVLGFHNPDDVAGVLRAGVERLLARLPFPLQRKIRLIDCPGAGRGAPLNDLLEAAQGVYASFLDDDDLLVDHHVETLVRGIKEHGPDVMFQTFAARRLLSPVPAYDADGVLVTVPEAGMGGTATEVARAAAPPTYPYTVAAMSIPWDRPFDPIEQHHHNLVPICCMAVPTRLIRQTGLRFRLDLDVGEDWDFWMSAAQLVRVVVLPEVTAIVNHWNDAVSNTMRRPDLAPIWQQVRDTRHRDQASVPLLLDGRVRPELQRLGRQPEELAWLRDELARRSARLASIQRSRVWRIAELVWRARGWVGRAFRSHAPI